MSDAVYDRITVAGPEIVGVRLTQAAYAHGLALALPAKVGNGAPDRIRTCDLRLRRPTLYPLSYRRADHDHTDSGSDSPWA